MELVNRKKLDEKYNFFTENIAIYQATSDNPKKWENNQNWYLVPNERENLTLSGKPLTFQIKEKYIDNDYPIVLALDNGKYQVKENTETRPKPVNYLSVEEGEY
ncbi:hypothetical protein AKJ52_03045 [candidate division MSBL1 archaeon SCGC-AAA382C18]|uniref:Uncharacterized protein n=1 Tax=candidate division MSBL1 archaeon SCGC-AAA382C18 TaxID=1698281 RepID=A0A133VH72_9EURY|nr:hypothetical protein AKJ52_03045 [candidate division MSBL1 archaeon SCGC-AAA382C18]